MEKPSILLFHPPYGDYTYPYHSLSYLVAPLRQAGYEVEAVDLNVEWFRSLFTSDTLRAWREEIRRSLERYEAMPRWTVADQEEVVRIVRSLAVAESLEPEEAVEILRSERFYDYESYLKAQTCVRNFERLLEYVYPNFPFYTTFEVPPGEPNARELLEGALGSTRFMQDVEAFFRRRFGGREFLFCGMSAPFDSHLRLGFAALAAAGRVFPGAARLAGGTAVTDMFKNRLSDQTLGGFSQVCDYLLAGEGDETIVQFAHWRAGRAPDPPRGLMDLQRCEVFEAPPKPVYLQLNVERPMPDYSWVNWDLYLSPSKQVNYSPTRGCFWNQCTFCDYGLNDDRPTAPYRGSQIDVVVGHLKEIRSQGIENVYFAVDAIAPNLVRDVAKRLLEEGLQIAWSAEFFLNKQFTPEMVALLERSGLVTASFGFESGESRVLEKMGKGKRRAEDVHGPVFQAFRQSGVGLQPKFFFGFPGETDADRWTTVRVLTENRDVFSVVTSGNIFDLTMGSAIAKSPADFGVRDVRRKPGSDIGGGCDYDLLDGSPRPLPGDFEAFNKALDYFHTYERPWAGGIDTFHTKLYVQRYGRDIFHRLRETYRERQDVTYPWAALQVQSHFDIDEVFDNVLVSAAARYSCNLSKLTEAMGDEELKQALAEIEEPIPRGETTAGYSIRFH